MTIEIVRGNDADALLASPAFRADWDRLCAECPWATPFQAPAFAATWYASYRARFEPLLSLARAADGRLQGLLPLAAPVGGRGGLVVAGAWQAEYHAWVCAAGHAGTFPWLALRAAQRACPSTVSFRYLPPGVPTDWLSAREPARRAILQGVPRPLMRFGDGSDVRTSLAKEGNKSRIRRMKKIGPVEFKRVTDAAELAAAFGHIADCCDVRQASIHGDPPFRNDPCKTPFHLAMAAVPGLLHTTVLTVGGRVAAAHLGAIGRREVALGLIAHDPRFAQHSPGKILTLYLARMLHEEGVEQLDLTPGGDAYKERFANAWDEVHTLTVYPSAAAGAVGAAAHRADAVGRRTLARVGVTPRQFRIAAAELLRARPVPVARTLAAAARGWVGDRRQTRLYVRAALAAVTPTQTRGHLAEFEMGRDAVTDLLAYEPVVGRPSRRAFLAEALSRIEDGQHAYTCAAGGRLLHAGWMVDRPTAEMVKQVLPGVRLPPNTSLIVDLCPVTDEFGPADRRLAMAEASVRAMLEDANRPGGPTAVAIALSADDADACRLVEGLGFAHRLSVIVQTSFGGCERQVVVNHHPAAAWPQAPVAPPTPPGGRSGTSGPKGGAPLSGTPGGGGKGAKPAGGNRKGGPATAVATALAETPPEYRERGSDPGVLVQVSRN